MCGASVFSAVVCLLWFWGVGCPIPHQPVPPPPLFPPAPPPPTRTHKFLVFLHTHLLQTAGDCTLRGAQERPSPSGRRGCGGGLRG